MTRGVLVLRTYRAFGYDRNPSNKTRFLFEEKLAGMEHRGNVRMADDAERAVTLRRTMTDAPF